MCCKAEMAFGALKIPPTNGQVSPVEAAEAAAETFNGFNVARVRNAAPASLRPNAVDTYRISCKQRRSRPIQTRKGQKNGT